MQNFRTVARALACCALAAVGGCGSGRDGSSAAPDGQSVLTGTVTYRERIALPSNARVEVRLEDVSQADAPADEIAAQTIAANGKQVPIPFELRYSPQNIDSSHRYAVRASITSADGDLMFTTSVHYAVLTNGAADKGVEIVVQRPGGGVRGAATDAPGVDRASPGGAAPALPDGTWRLVAIQRPGAAEQAVGADPRYTVAFADGMLSGFAHCNRYTGGYEQPAPGQLKVLPMAATLMACPGESIGSEFLRALGGATRYELRGDRLLLSYGDGGVLSFVRDEPGAAAERQSDAVAVAAAGDCGQRDVDCKSNPRKAPWVDAARCGAAFRALGNEHGCGRFL